MTYVDTTLHKCLKYFVIFFHFPLLVFLFVIVLASLTNTQGGSGSLELIWASDVLPVVGDANGILQSTNTLWKWSCQILWTKSSAGVWLMRVSPSWNSCSPAGLVLLEGLSMLLPVMFVAIIMPWLTLSAFLCARLFSRNCWSHFSRAATLSVFCMLPVGLVQLWFVLVLDDV